METVESKITSKGQISIPASVRRKLGLTKGSRIEWREHNGEIIVKRVTEYSSEDIHKAVFDKAPATVSPGQMDEGIQALMRKKYARR